MKKRTERALLLGALSLAAIKAQKDGAAMSAREAARLREALERTYLSDWGHVPEGERPRPLHLARSEESQLVIVSTLSCVSSRATVWCLKSAPN
jgi:hypothetical protein